MGKLYGCVLRNGKIRICLDPKDLNNAIKREHHPMKTVEEVVASIPGTISVLHIGHEIRIPPNQNRRGIVLHDNVQHPHREISVATFTVW